MPHSRPHDAETAAAQLPSAHVKPSSINSSEVRLRHEHEIAANGGHEVHHGEESRLSGRTVGGTGAAGEGPSSAPPNNSREAASAAGMNHGILSEKLHEKDASHMA